MEKLDRIESIALIVDEANVDTDVIFPARYLLRIDRAGMDEFLFRDRRYARDGSQTDFIFNAPHAAQAKIVVAGENFGCGSSREQAVWSLHDFGIRCVIAPSFGDIFSNNASRNGLLLVRPGAADYAALIGHARIGGAITIDLPAQTIAFGDTSISFDIEPHVKTALMEGLDEIGFIMRECGDDIARFETRHAVESPWLFQPEMLK